MIVGGDKRVHWGTGFTWPSAVNYNACYNAYSGNDRGSYAYCNGHLYRAIATGYKDGTDETRASKD